MSEISAAVATKEKNDATNGGELVRLWLDALEIASKEESDWRERAQKVVDQYRQSSSDPNDRTQESRKFNILYSNIETTIPALYNSTPAPDVRRRFNDPDPIAKAVCDITERSLSYSIDSYDFDSTIAHAVKDMELVGRGVTRVRYQPYVQGDQIAGEEVLCEHVPWKHYRRGPASRHDELPWEAFELFLTRGELEKLSPELGSKVSLDCEAGGVLDKRDGRNIPEIYKRARVWEIWDKESRQVLFISTGYKDAPLAVIPDPLGIVGFFCTPRPLYAITSSDSLKPVIPFEQYKSQADELERVSQRILVLTEAVKARALYDGRMAGEMSRLEDADDADNVPIENIAMFADGSKLADHIAWYPIEAITAALEKLYIARDQIKQTIYEITGISDILRGETQASETATAQQIKQNWGSLRIQIKQREIQRYVRDLFRIKSELIASKFQWQTITMMTGLNFPPMAVKQQAQQFAQSGQPVPPEFQDVLSKPSQEEVEQLFRNDLMRGFRIDIESDSTIRADQTRNQQNMSLFLQGTAQYAAAMGPLVMAHPDILSVVMEVYSAFARNFKLGKQAEDALDGIADQAKAAAQQPPPNAEEEKAKAEIELKKQETEGKLKLAQEESQAKIQLQREDMAARRDMDMQKMAGDHALAREKTHLDAMVKAESAASESEDDDSAEAPKRSGGSGIAAAALIPLMTELTKQLKMSNAPKRIVRDQNGQAVGVEPMVMQ